MAQVLGVGGVFFKSRSPRSLARWYSRCLGFPLVGPTAAMFKAARMPKPSYTVWSVFSVASRYFRPSASQHMVNFLVDDVEGALAQVIAAGGKAIGRVRDHPYGRFGWFLDPEGNKVELWQLLPVKRRGSKKRR
jgi:predicted enzyme related to lactoylglutathione lyase